MRVKLKTLIVLEASCGLAIACLAVPWIAEAPGFAGPTVGVDLNVPNLGLGVLPGDRVTLVYNTSFGPGELAIKEGLVVARRGGTFTIRVTPAEAKRLGESGRGADIGLAHLATFSVRSRFQRIWDRLTELF